MKWYFASRVRHKEKLQEIARFLEGVGEEVVSDWIYADSLKPYEENLSKVQPFAEGVTKALLATDIFVLISDQEGTDMFIELGVGLAKKVLSDNIKIYIMGEHSRRSLMQLHPAIIHAKDLQAVLALEKIDYESFVCPEFR
jgi:hypothetical protein